MSQYPYVFYILTLIPSSLRYFLRSGMAISPKWNTLAARAASALPWVNASRKCSIFPAPPEAMIGMPESAIRHSTHPQYSDASWAAMYRGIGTAEPCWVGDSMVVRMMGLVGRWNHQAWFDYVDRWVTVRSASPYRFTVPDQPSTPQNYAQTALIKKVYDTYRPSFDARRLFRNVRVSEVEP